MQQASNLLEVRQFADFASLATCQTYSSQVLQAELGGIYANTCRLVHNVMPLSRNSPADSVFAPCDLVTQLPQRRDTIDPAASNVDWIIHQATTYRVDDDLAMLDNLIRFAQDESIENVLYVSSWVVNFPRRRLRSTYIEMKRRWDPVELSERTLS